MSRLLGGGAAGGAMFGVPGPSAAPATPAAAPAGGGNPYQLQGQLPFQAGGNPFSGDISGAYQSSYNSALAQNQALYSNILGGYNQTMANQLQAQQGIQQGYGALKGEVLGDIQGITASQQQAIRDVYAQQQGASQQSMINRGLGNTTVMDSMQRGLTLDEQKAQIALANQQSQLTAGYASQLGSAGLAYQNQANMQNTGQANQALNWMNSVTAQYPNAQSYAQLQYNQGLMNALQGRAGMNAVPGLGGLGGAGLGAAPHPFAPPAPGPYSSGYVGAPGSDLGTFEGAYGSPGPSPYLARPGGDTGGISGYNPDTAQLPAMGPTPGLDVYSGMDYGSDLSQGAAAGLASIYGANPSYISQYAAQGPNPGYDQFGS